MAYLRRLPKSPFWIAGFTLPDGQRTQRSTKCKDRKAAMKLAEDWEDAAQKRVTEAQARRVLSDIHERIHGTPLSSPTVSGFVKQWLGRKSGETAPSTARSYESTTTSFISFLGTKAEQPIHYVTQSQIAAWRDAAAQKTSTRTANNKLKVIRVFFQSAWRDGLLTENPAAKVQTLRSVSTERRPFTMPELRSLLALADEEWRGMILFGLYTGQRLGDIATLQWQQIDLAQGEISFRTGKTGRRVLLPLASALKSYLGERKAPAKSDEPVFRNASATVGTQGRTGNLSNHFAALLGKANLIPKRTHKKATNGKGRSAERTASRLSFHCLRHTATSLLKNAGVSEAITRDIIGHESAEISRHYTHVDSTSKRDAIAKLPNLLAS